jgi:glycosyltransferase involved in cell wall biosynthesis
MERKKMRVVFINLHANEMLVKTMPKYVFKQSVAIKHKYLLDYLLSNSDYEVCSYVNENGFDLFHNGPIPVVKFVNLFRFLEHKIVLKKNEINVDKVKVLKNISDIRSDDIVVIYRHHYEQLNGVEKINSFKAVSMIHFLGKSREANALKKAKIDCMFNESNLQKNSEIFRRFYDFSGTWVIHPFVYEERFQNKKPFRERKNMAFATGTITYRDSEEHLTVYGDSCVQPLRKQIKDNIEYFNGIIMCTSSDYNEDFKVKKVSSKDNILVCFFKVLYNRMHTGQQKKYYSFNMVDAFNDYKMCIVGEENLGVPGIGFVEGMACGCAYIGLDSPMYTDVGLIPGVHYITYDGTKEDLKRVIEYYQADEHQKELEQIAKTGCEYVRTHFNGDTVAKKLLKDLEIEQKKWLANRKLNGRV